MTLLYLIHRCSLTDHSYFPNATSRAAPHSNCTRRAIIETRPTVLCQMLLSCNRANGAISRTCYTRVRNNLILMMPHRRLGHRTHVARARLQHIRMIGREDCCGGTDDGAEGIVHFLRLGLVDGRLEGGTLRCRAGIGGDGDRRM